MMRPPFVMSGTAFCARRLSASALVSMHRRQCFVLSSRAGFKTPIAALLTTKSTRSNSFRKVANASATLSAIAHVGLNRLRAPAKSAKGLADRRSLVVAVVIDDRNVATGSAQFQRNGPADPARTARNEGYLSC